MNSIVPSGWNYEALGKCCTIVSGATPRRDVPEFWGQDIAWVTPKDISNLDGPILEDAPEYISNAGFKSCSASILPKGSVLFSSRAPIGLVALTGREMCTNQGFKSLVPGEGVHSHYLYHCMKWMAPKIAELGNGATFKEVSKEVISRVEIPIPPLGEQKRIAAILDNADAIRRKRQQAIKLADDFLRATFLDMFGDPVTNPKGWDYHCIDEIAEIQGGLQVTSKRKSNLIEVPYLRVANVYRDLLDLTDIKNIMVTQEELNRTMLQNGDILVVEGHGNPKEIGRTSVWNGSIAPCTHQNHLIRVRIHRNIAEPIYVSAFLNSYGGRQQLLGFGKTTSGLNTISTSNVKCTKILLPPMILQKKYCKVVVKLSATTQKINLYMVSTNKLFNSLSQRAFRGEL